MVFVSKKNVFSVKRNFYFPLTQSYLYGRTMRMYTVHNHNSTKKSIPKGWRSRMVDEENQTFTLPVASSTAMRKIFNWVSNYSTIRPFSCFIHSNEENIQLSVKLFMNPTGEGSKFFSCIYSHICERGLDGWRRASIFKVDMALTCGGEIEGLRNSANKVVGTGAVLERMLESNCKKYWIKTLI